MSETSAFSLLTDLADKARLSAIELPPEQATQTHWTGLGFNLLGQRFVAPMDEVGELSRAPSATRVPGVKNFVLGVGNVRGRLMTVIDLAIFFGQASQLARSQRRVLAVEVEEQYFGFMIDDSFGMQHFPSDSFSETAGDVPEMFNEYVRGSFHIAGTEWPVLSLSSLAGDKRLEKLAITH